MWYDLRFSRLKVLSWFLPTCLRAVYRIKWYERNQVRSDGISLKKPIGHTSNSTEQQQQWNLYPNWNARVVISSPRISMKDSAYEQAPALWRECYSMNSLQNSTRTVDTLYLSTMKCPSVQYNNACGQLFRLPRSGNASEIFSSMRQKAVNSRCNLWIPPQGKLRCKIYYNKNIVTFLVIPPDDTKCYFVCICCVVLIYSHPFLLQKYWL